MEQLVKSLGSVNAKFPTHLMRQTGKTEMLNLYFVHGRGLHHQMFIELVTLVGRQRAIQMIAQQLLANGFVDRGGYSKNTTSSTVRIFADEVHQEP